MKLAELKALLVITSQLSGLPIPDNVPLPYVHAVPGVLVQEALCGDNPGDDCEEVYGFYDPNTGDVWVQSDTQDYSANTILVHELTHWLEQHNSVNTAATQMAHCLNELEAHTVEEAYMLQYEHIPSKRPGPVCTP